MKYLKQVVLSFTFTLSMQANIKDYKFIKLSEYQGNIPELIEEFMKEKQDEVFVICKKNGKIANFIGIKTSQKSFKCEKANKLIKQMSKEDKQKIYIRKFNGKIQLWECKNR